MTLARKWSFWGAETQEHSSAEHKASCVTCHKAPAFRSGGGGERDHWYWISGASDQTLKEETAGVRLFILSVPSLFIENQDMLRPDAETKQSTSSHCFTDRKSETWQHQETCLWATESVRHRTQNQVSRFSVLCLFGPGKERKIKASNPWPFCCRPQPQHTYIWPPSYSFCKLTELCSLFKLMLTKRCLAKTVFSCWAVFV